MRLIEGNLDCLKSGKIRAIKQHGRKV
jgi:hypothetical protein